MSNSKLVSYKKLSPNTYGKRTAKIDRITPHCVVGQCSVETLGALFANKSRQASSNYGIGSDGRVGLYVNEDCAAWTSSNYGNDERAVTIEVASDTYSPYKMNTKAYNALVDLCVDICKRNKKKKLLWISDKTKALNYKPKEDEMLLTIHRWFSNKSCPGPWLVARLGSLASTVTKRLGNTNDYKVRIIKDVVVREKPSTLSKKKGIVTKGGSYTIVEESANKKWGKLKSGYGWIALKGYTEKVK